MKNNECEKKKILTKNGSEKNIMKGSKGLWATLLRIYKL